MTEKTLGNHIELGLEVITDRPVFQTDDLTETIRPLIQDEELAISLLEELILDGLDPTLYVGC